MEKQIKLEMRKVADLIPYAMNARTHTDEQVTRVASSIKEFGFLNPVIISNDNGILAGHCRVMAAKKLGLQEVPCILENHLTETQKKAYILADNKLALDSGWDEEILKIELEGLKEIGGGYESFSGFSDEEIDLAINGWESDLGDAAELNEKDLDKERIALKVKIKEAQRAKEIIANALEQQGVWYAM